MVAGWLTRVQVVVLLSLAAMGTAHAGMPGSELTRLNDGADNTYTSPDGQIVIEQYWRKAGEDDRVWEFWAFDARHEHGVLLNPGEATNIAGYPAGFRFSRNSRLVVRMQKTGAGYHTLFLYKRDDFSFSSATPKPLGEMAWDYFYSQPVSRKIHRMPKDRRSLNHAQVNLLQGVDDNYASKGRKWPDSRYLLLSLSFDAQGEDKKLPWVEDWQCVFDTRTDQFSIPADLVAKNIMAVRYPELKRKQEGPIHARQ